MSLKQDLYSSIKYFVIIERLGNWGRRKLKLTALINELEPEPSKDKDNISFNPIGKDGKRIKGKRRLKLTIPRFLTRQLNLNDNFFTDEVIRKISDNLIEKYFPQIILRLDKGVKITENYENEIGGSSCMTGSCAHFTRLYEMNPKRFEQLVIIYNNDSARAIVSTLDSGKKCRDRVYSTSDYTYTRLKEYAREQGWDNAKDNDLIITGLIFRNGCIPYMDTFKYYKIENNKLNIYANRPTEYDGYLENTGGYLDGDYVNCQSCEGRIHSDDSCVYNNNNYCENCFCEEFTDCERCGTTAPRDEIIEVDNVYMCEDCVDNLAIVCDACEKRTLSDNSHEVEYKNICTICYDECITCNECEEIFLPDNIKDGLCKDCLESQGE